MHYLVCLPFAGAGPSIYSGWSGPASPIAVRPASFPGKERRVAETPLSNLRAAAELVATDILAYARERDRVSLFGHCYLGSVLAYEVALRIQLKRPELLSTLFVSASRPPCVSRHYGVSELSDTALIARLKQLTGFSHPALEIPEMRALLMPALRADFLMDETYEPREKILCQCSLVAIAAESDASVSPNEVLGWKDYVAEDVEFWQVEGGHMYLMESPREIAARVAARLQQVEEV